MWGRRRTSRRSALPFQSRRSYSRPMGYTNHTCATPLGQVIIHRPDQLTISTVPPPSYREEYEALHARTFDSLLRPPRGVRHDEPRTHGESACGAHDRVRARSAGPRPGRSRRGSRRRSGADRARDSAGRRVCASGRRRQTEPLVRSRVRCPDPRRRTARRGCPRNTGVCPGGHRLRRCRLEAASQICSALRNRHRAPLVRRARSLLALLAQLASLTAVS